MVRYAVLLQVLLFYIRLMKLGRCSTLPPDWRSKIHSSILATLDSGDTTARWSSRSDIIEDESSFGMRTAAQRTGQLFPYNYWPKNGKCIPFRLHSAFDADPETRQRILNAMRTIERRTHSCLTFKMWSNEPEYIHVYPGIHCEADVGRIPGKVTRVRLSGDCMQNGVLLHELLHALGFFHQHNRPDRDHFLEIFPDHVELGKYDPNFIILRNMSNHGILYDFESIMHYSPLAFAYNSSTPTMVPKVPLPVRMGQQEYLSALDVAKLNRAYGCIDNHFESVPQAVLPTCTVDRYLGAPAPAETTALSTTTRTETVLQTRCNTPEAEGNASWLMRDADTLWPLNDTLVTASVQSVLDGVVICPVQNVTSTTNPFGEFLLSLPKNNDLQFEITFEVSGYYPITVRTVQINGNSDASTTFMEPLLFISRRFVGLGTAGGTLRDFSADHAVGYVKLEFRSDMNSHAGTVVKSVTSTDGTWSVTLPQGHYTATPFKKDHIPVPFTVIVVGGKTRSYGNKGLWPIIKNGGIRIVTSGWNVSRRVYLSLHVRGPVLGKSELADTHRGFGPGSRARTSPDGLVRYALDTYEIASILIEKQLAGIYRISVADWLNIDQQRGRTFWDMANSGVSVQLYTGSTLWAQYFMPHRMGNAWSVVEINGTHLKTVNEVKTVTRDLDMG